jgi:poly(A) polymerase
VREKADQLGKEQLRPTVLISGSDLIAAGYKPGPAFKEALTAVETAQLEGELHSRDEAMAMARVVLEREPPYSR